MSKNGKVIQRWNIISPSCVSFPLLMVARRHLKTDLWEQLVTNGASLVYQMVKNLPTLQDTRVWSLGWENLLEKGMATPSSILAWRIPRTEEPGGLLSMGSQRVRHNWTLALSVPYFSRGKLKAAHHIEISLVRMDGGCFTVFTPLLIHSLISLLFCWSFPATCPVLPWGRFQPSGVIMCKDQTLPLSSFHWQFLWNNVSYDHITSVVFDVEMEPTMCTESLQLGSNVFSSFSHPHSHRNVSNQRYSFMVSAVFTCLL